MNCEGGQGIVVGVGDCRVASFPSSSLSTYALGSCLAILLYDWKSRTGGLLHVMLPDSSIDGARKSANPFMYVDTGVPELMRLFETHSVAKQRMRCCVAGGANMMANSAQFEIGKRNYLATRKIFWRLGIFIDREDVGGTASRSVRLDLANGQIDLRKGTDPEKVLLAPGIGLTGGLWQ